MNHGDLRRAIRQLPKLATGPRFSWNFRRSEIRQGILGRPIETFEEWPAAREFLVVGNTEAIDCEIASLETKTHDLQVNHQLYHLSMLPIDVSTLETVYEFGSGYGRMTYALRFMGFTGRIVSHDFPEMILLQEHLVRDDRITYTDRPIPGHYDLFIANCSLSEVPLEDRPLVLKGLTFTHHEVCYQATWKGVDNATYFADWGDNFPSPCALELGMRYTIA